MKSNFNGQSIHHQKKNCFTSKLMKNSMKNSKKKRDLLCKDSISYVENTSYIVGKGVVLFTMFYTTLNWLHYNRIVDNVDKNKKDDNND
jgi:hypothetical protein